MIIKAESKYRICRQVGHNIWYKKKNNIKYGKKPGQKQSHLVNTKQSLYGKQLREKQVLRKYYGNLTDKQLLSIYKLSLRHVGDSIHNFIVLLERRLETVVYRMNFTDSIFAARQLISHKHILVNGKTINIPSYRVKDNDVIQVKGSSVPFVLKTMENNLKEGSFIVNHPSYLEVNYKILAGVFLYSPSLEEVPFPFKINYRLVHEFYSR